MVDTLIGIAQERGAAAIVIGLARHLGAALAPTRSVSRKLLEHSDRPVLVIRAE